MTPENVRFHAAGHLASAAMLVEAGDLDGASIILRAIQGYVHNPQVICPPLIKQMVGESIANSGSSLEQIKQLERWFVDPLNSELEAQH